MSGVEATMGFGASVLGIASAGISVATTLTRFSISYNGSAEKIEDLSSRVSLTATILTTIGNTIENHKDYFKEDNFREKFGRVTDRCKKDYGILGQALNKAKGELDGLGSERERKVRKMTPWRKLIWALGGEERMKDLQSSLKESKTRVLMMQSAASLIVLQILGRKRILTEDENNDLAELKHKMILLYTFLQEAKLLSAGPTKSPMRGSRRESSSSAEKLNQNVEGEVVVIEGSADEQSTHEKHPVEPEVVTVEKDPSPARSRERERVVIEDSPRRVRTRSPPPPPQVNKQATTGDKPVNPTPTQSPFYEAWAILDKRFFLKIKTFQLFGIKLKIKENSLADLDSYSGLAATQSELKDLIAQLRPHSSSSATPSTFKQLTALPSGCARTVTHLISIRANATKFAIPPRTWAIEVLAPWSSLPSSCAPKLTQNISIDTLKSQDPGYLLILRSPSNEDDQPTIPAPDFDPFQEKRIPFRTENRNDRFLRREPEIEYVRKGRKVASSIASSSRSWLKPWETARKMTRDEDIKARQKEAETAVNDFLATFSSLYDDVPEDERTKVLDSIAAPVAEEDDIWGSEGSTRSNSFVDD